MSLTFSISYWVYLIFYVLNFMKIKVDILVFLKVWDSFKHRSCTTWCNPGFTQENVAAENTRWQKLVWFLWHSPFALLWLPEKYNIYSNLNFKVMIPTLIGQIMMQYLGFISFFKVFLSHYKISFRKTGSVFWCGLIPLHLWLLSLPCKKKQLFFLTPDYLHDQQIGLISSGARNI